MSSLVLRGLLLPENTYQSSTEAVRLKGLYLKKEHSDDSGSGAQSLKKLDTLSLSGTSGSSKGRIPIQLMDPNELTSGENVRLNKSVSYAKPQKFNVPGLNQVAKPQSQGKPKLYSLSDLQISSATYTSSTSFTSSASYVADLEGKKVVGSSSSRGNVSVSQSINFIDSNDGTADKLSTAIEKIDNWNRKVSTLNKILEQQQSAANGGDKNVLLNGTRQLTKARTEAIDAREDAMNSYNEALKEMKSQLSLSGVPDPRFRNYNIAFNLMEEKFSDTEIKDRTTMQKVGDYLKVGFGLANPFNYR